MRAREVEVIDSHTGGEPTRVVLGGRDEDWFRRAVICEPRGSDVLVGALLLEPEDPNAAARVIFFNNVGRLGMCGHGTIGLVTTLAYMGRIRAGKHMIETPVGDVWATLHEDGQVTVENVPSYRLETVELGDIAWGGNWFLLARDHGERIAMDNVERLTARAWEIRRALGRPEVDHVELFGEATVAGANSKNFVLCPGGAYDRSPCGTGTSAKIACLAADGKLGEGEIWRQESIVGSVFEASYRWDGDKVIPRIKGLAFVTGHGKLILDPRDPFVNGIGP